MGCRTFICLSLRLTAFLNEAGDGEGRWGEAPEGARGVMASLRGGGGGGGCVQGRRCLPVHHLLGLEDPGEAIPNAMRWGEEKALTRFPLPARKLEL